MTPVFFGSAMTNLGFELFLHYFLEYALKPGNRNSNVGEIEPSYPEFSGFVFKLQANMDPKHRDRVAFVRVCTGKFEKDMNVSTLARAKTFVYRAPKNYLPRSGGNWRGISWRCDRLNNPGVFAIGDTIYTGSQKLEYEGIPCFSPELFAFLRNPNPPNLSSFKKG